MKKTIKILILVIVGTLGMMEVVASLYYFQKGPHDSPFAVGQMWQGVKMRIMQSGISEGNRERLHVHVNDDELGWSLNPNITVVADCGESKPIYTIDSNKKRFIPKPQDSVGQILFLGGAITFGDCVSDQEAYPAILATEYWKKWDVQNSAVIGWSTTQAYMMLSRALKSDSPPSLVIYGMTPHHLDGNYLRRTWLASHTGNGRKQPYFELMNGELEFQGTVGLSSGIDVGPKLRKKEHEITSAYLKAMQKLCAEKNVPFIVILLPPWDRYPLPVMNTLQKSNFLLLDLTEMEYDAPDPDKENHLKPMFHRRLATAIANSFVSKMLGNMGKPVKGISKNS